MKFDLVAYTFKDAMYNLCKLHNLSPPPQKKSARNVGSSYKYDPPSVQVSVL